ncbi:MAG: diguanylate cyclase [Myxococcota bacterium]
MKDPVYIALRIRRTLRNSYGFAVGALVVALTLLGLFSDAEPRPEHGVIGGMWLAAFGARMATRLRRSRPEGFPWIDIELGLLLLAGVQAVVQMAGGQGSLLHPIVYIAVAFLAAFAEARAGLVLVALALAYEVGLHLLAESVDLRSAAYSGSFIALFGALNLVFTRAEIARVREHSRKTLEGERERVRSDARMFRLVSAPSAEGASDEERLTRSSVEEVKQQLFHGLQMLHANLELHTCVLLLRDEETLRIAELVTESDHIVESKIGAGEGVVGAVVRRGQTMNLEHLKTGYKGITYYDGPAIVRSFIGIPVYEGSTLVGVLCADRLADRPFEKKDERILERSVPHLLRALQNERIFVQLERTKREQTVLHRASQAIGAALDEGAVIDAALEAAAEIAPFDFAAVTLYDAGERRHRVRRAVGEGAEAFATLKFRDNTSLTAMAVKNRHYLPYRGDFDPSAQVVFTKRTNLKGMASLLILPLIVREDAIGTLALAAKHPRAFGDSVRSTLSVLVGQLAVSMANAQAVARLEEMATTDGLTKCLNKRAFLEELERKLASAKRFQRPLSLIVTDIDHFKSVNDTYGHATGDVVIKELGEILRNVKRDTDIVARFGGEEFCVLCEETDTEGARLLAERIREELKGTTFQTELGKLNVTASLGVATFHGRKNASSSELFEASDKALYAAKHGGRDQVALG